MKNLDIRYLAGILDGEGNLGIKRGKGARFPLYQIIVRVGMCDTKVVKRLHEGFGGGYAVYPTKKANHRPAHYWYTTNHVLIKSLLVRLLPHLIVKKKQAKILLKFIDVMANWKRKMGYSNPPLTKSEVKKREVLFQQAKELNRKGIR